MRDHRVSSVRQQTLVSVSESLPGCRTCSLDGRAYAYRTQIGQQGFLRGMHTVLTDRHVSLPHPSVAAHSMIVYLLGLCSAMTAGDSLRQILFQSIVVDL